MREADWYFDFISPYAYFGLLRLQELGGRLEIRHRPILFAELLKRCGQKGPAEIPAKRLWTYRWCTWWAAEQRIPFRVPAAHPFNPLPYLRLAIATEADRHAIRLIFDTLWTTGVDPGDQAVLASLTERLAIDPARIVASDVKDVLRHETDSAVARGVFGVPTLVIDDQLFWGADATGFAKAYVVDPGIVAAPEMKRLVTVPIGAARTT
jgi:2-hydroxychromene-2-carboxylate isomerase